MTVSFVINCIVDKNTIQYFTVQTAFTNINCSSTVTYMVVIEFIIVNGDVCCIYPCNSRTCIFSIVINEGIVYTTTVSGIDFPT